MFAFRLAYLPNTVRATLGYTKYLTMAFTPMMLRKTKRYISPNWVHREKLDIVPAFAHKGGSDQALVDVRPSSN